MKFESSNEDGVLTLDGDLTVNRAEELHAMLLRALDKANHLVVKFDSITEVDLSFFQLLHSAQRTAKARGKKK